MRTGVAEPPVTMRPGVYGRCLMVRTAWRGVVVGSVPPDPDPVRVLAGFALDDVAIGSGYCSTKISSARVPRAQAPTTPNWRSTGAVCGHPVTLACGRVDHGVVDDHTRRRRNPPGVCGAPDRHVPGEHTGTPRDVLSLPLGGVALLKRLVH